MILVFGGTTEGRKAAEVLEEAGKPFFYSTKTGEQEVALQHGQRIDGAMDAEAMAAFCREHGIRLIVDAAHPFAARLHQTVARVADGLSLPAIRYERIFPPRDESLTWIDDYSQVPRDIRSLLATTGVQSISKLKYLEAEGIQVFYRILPRPSSVQLAHEQGATDQQLCFYEDGETIDTPAEAILLKESGLSGGFRQKVEAARRHGMRVIVLRRPTLPQGFRQVNGPYGLRRMVERLLPGFYALRSGLTTGTCATAAAVAEWWRVMGGRSPFTTLPAEVPVILPDGETIMVPVGYGDGYAYCIKDAGDDPDVTDGLEIRAAIAPIPSAQDVPNPSSATAPIPSAQEPEGMPPTPCEILIEGGEGVGRFTLPGFDYPPGEAAINRVPRQMIVQNLLAVFSTLHPSPSTSYPPSTLHPSPSTITITISVPDGERIARKTFNPRLGIEGGISIIGVSGIVMPFSEEAFIESIHKCMQVARAAFAPGEAAHVVINSGAKSERYVRALCPQLPPQAFVEYGNYIGHTLQMATELGFRRVTLGVMLGKAVKLAAGHLDTHSRRATMDKAFIAQMLGEAGLDTLIPRLPAITLARELWQMIPPDRTEAFCRVVIGHCMRHCRPLFPAGELTVILIDDDGHCWR